MDHIVLSPSSFPIAVGFASRAVDFFQKEQEIRITCQWDEVFPEIEESTFLFVFKKRKVSFTVHDRSFSISIKGKPSFCKKASEAAAKALEDKLRKEIPFNGVTVDISGAKNLAHQSLLALPSTTTKEPRYP